VTYFKDMDEYTDAALDAEIRRRAGLRSQGKCTYCERGHETPACRFSDRHHAGTDEPMPPVQINEMARTAFAIADSKGWWDFAARPASDGDAPCRPGVTMTPTEVTAQLALVMTEASEAIECVRDGDYAPRVSTEKPGKPEGLPSELADIMIRVGQLAYAMGIDLETAIRTKMDHNAVRVHRHGGRLL
jgi:NTP pyrophosphatase (non-canonical NTP hydrolase)